MPLLRHRLLSCSRAVLQRVTEVEEPPCSGQRRQGSASAVGKLKSGAVASFSPADEPAASLQPVHNPRQPKPAPGQGDTRKQPLEEGEAPSQAQAALSSQLPARAASSHANSHGGQEGSHKEALSDSKVRLASITLPGSMQTDVRCVPCADQVVVVCSPLSTQWTSMGAQWSLSQSLSSCTAMIALQKAAALQLHHQLYKSAVTR